MSLLDRFSGGKSNEASDALKRAEQYFASIKTPTQDELTLPELQKYVEAGIMTPAEAQSYLQDRNAYSDQSIDQTGTGAQISALNQLADVAGSGAQGTPMEQANIENALERMNTGVAGQRGAIEQQMAARGMPSSLISAALQNQSVGQEAQQAHLDAVNAAGQNYQTALNAMAERGAVGNALQGQTNAQSNQVAQAQNAMQQFNAQNRQQTSQFNAGNQQSANVMNAANKQQVSNNNTGLGNARTQYNAAIPEQMFQNSMDKAKGMAGAATDYANLEQKQGQQNAGIWSGLINTATSFIPKPPGASSQGGMPGYSANNPTTQDMNQSYQQGWYAHGGVVNDPIPPPVASTRGYHDHSICMAHGGYCLADGGEVPGDAPFAGDTTANDVVDAHLSPGEAVIPRSTVEERPDDVADLLGDDQEEQGGDIDSEDVALLLKALKSIRMGVV